MDALSRRRGFTLLEMLVVLAVAAVLTASFVALAWPSGASTLEGEARRLASLLELAIAESRATGMPIDWRPEVHGYSFWRRNDDGEWVPFPADSPYRRRTFASGIALRAEATVLYPYGFATPLRVEVAAGDRILVVEGGVVGRFSIARLYAN